MSATRVAVVTVSDSVTQGTRDDTSGALAASILRDAGFDVAAHEVVPDERHRIEEVLRRLCDGGFGLVVTSGGTGFGPRDVTPEATRAVIEREAPGLGELMRAAGLLHTPQAALSRAVAGARGRSLILNLPGSPKAVREGLDVVLPVLPHAVELLAGAMGAHPTGHGPSPDPAAQEQGMTDPPVGRGGGWVDVKAVATEGDPPCAVGSAMQIVPGGAVRGTLGCAEFDSAAVRDAAEVLAAGGAGTRTYEHELGTVQVYLEPHRQPPVLIVVSATGVARALAGHVGGAGFRTVLLEPREERIEAQDRARFDGVEQDAGALTELADDASVVFTDHDAPGIADQLERVLRSQAGFIGVMGSRRHVAHYVEDLRGRGISKEDLARIRSPLGLDLGGRASEEIALSIAAGLVAARHGKDGGWLDR
ncbi:MAG: molybdenum cofactor synthesis domain-containing protein [Actinomycetota bacterium]